MEVLPVRTAGNYKLKAIYGIVDEVPFFSANVLTLVKKVASYTISPLETVLRAAVPAAVMRPGAREKTQLFVEPAQSAHEAPAQCTARQKWLYAQIVRLGGGWMNMLARELKTTPQSLRVLEALGLVKIAPHARRRDPFADRKILPSRPLALNAGQAAALKEICAAEKPVLLYGVTGSGKTEVYLQAIAHELEAGRGAIVMVPEISLTPQTVQRFRSRFGDMVAVLHSALSDGERYDEWHRIRSGGARVVVGPRSAVFAPVSKLGLIVVDEEHDTSYKQDSVPRYNARDVAVMRAKIEGARVVLGSATPSLESWRNVESGKYAIARMPDRAGAGKLPGVGIVDMSEEKEKGIFSSRLLDAISTRLERAEQTILFLNRRGYSRAVICASCAEPIMCDACSVAYTYHKADSCLRCHVCGAWRELPRTCPKCGAAALEYRGIGTQRVECALKACFPDARILRMDADSTRGKNSHDDILGAFRRGEADILLGTQMIAKGLDFPRVTLVGVLNADVSLNMPDFRASEHTYQLLSQVAGRAGRAELPGEVYIQTFNPDAPAIVSASRGDFAAFAAQELQERREANFPPYCKLATLGISSRDQALAASWSAMCAESFASFSKNVPGFHSSEAYPSAIEKADGWYRWQIVVRSPTQAAIAAAWKWFSSSRPPAKDVRLVIDMDAYSVV